MRKLLLVLLAFIAVFTYIRTIERANASESRKSEFVSVEPEISGSAAGIDK
ncbi:MAG: hypothetical protein LBB81_06325 [Treponema sp.]|jgi:hypothetical protein|nr:hypothetical protein [Treponema sp.]